MTTDAHAPAPHPLRTLLQGLLRDRFFLIMLAALPVLYCFSSEALADYPSLVDWPTIATLTGLLLLTKGLEAGGAMHWLGHKLIAHMDSERSAALWLVGAAALLSTVLTNDVALFAIVPLSLGICRLTGMPATRLIVFEALAVNAGSALTPVGNPQNLFLWQQSGVSFGAFVWHMLPLVALCMVALLALTWCVFGKRRIAAQDDSEAPQAMDGLLCGLSLLLYLPFLAAADLHHEGWAVLVVLLTFLVLRRRVLLQLDWGLLLVFVLMFVDLRLFAGLDAVRGAIRGLGLEQATHLYFAGIAASQLVSNVPAAIALSEYTHDWHVLAYAVNVGGFGFMLGSLANLIALRLSGDGRGWRMFHAYSLPFLALATLLGYLLLFV